MAAVKAACSYSNKLLLQVKTKQECQVSDVQNDSKI